MTAITETQQQGSDAYWLPYSSNRNFKDRPRMFVGASGMHYRTDDNREVLDSTSGLWCCNCGHGCPSIARAIQKQVTELDYVPAFQVSHPKVFELANRLVADIFPGDLNRILLTNAGSEAVDTALKLALAYQQLRGKGSKTLLVGRDRGYHGVGFGGVSVGGIAKNRAWYSGNLLRTAHLPHTHDLSRNAFSRGQPEHGAELANALEGIINLHDSSTIAAVIVEPVAGSSGVLIPPKGYLERLRAICDQHDILLIFDEVITAFGRLGAPTGAARFGVEPDMITFAKAVSNGMVPLGGVALTKEICDTFLEAAEGSAIDLFHGYTYSGHPVACAAALATLDFYQAHDLFNRVMELEGFFADHLHSFRDAPHVIDIRNLGIVGAIELESRPGKKGARAFDLFVDCFHNEDLLIRPTGDTIAIAPPLIASKEDIEFIFARLRKAIGRLA